MNVLLGCIADDFTGASDLAAILSRSGVAVNLRLGVPETDAPGADGDDLAPFEIVALKCRTSPPADAVREALDAWSWLAARGARRAYWKYCSTFDSTPEGNIGPVADALLEAVHGRGRAAAADADAAVAGGRGGGAASTDAADEADASSEVELATVGELASSGPASPLTIHCPAFPENGRSVYRSVLFVGDLPLDESPMRDHPLTPMRDANLVRVLRPQVRGEVGAITWPTVRAGVESLRERLDSLAREGVRHVIVDALDADDLLHIVRASERLPLLCGGSALALHLPALFRVRGWLAGTPEAAPAAAPDGGRMVLAGSCSAMTRRQVERFAETAPTFRLDPLALARDGQLDAARGWLDAQSPASAPQVVASAPPEAVETAQRELGRERAGTLVEEALGALARHAVERGRRSLVVAGGESAGAVCRALGVTRLRVGREIAPGVPWTHAEHPDGALALALKSGNFGEESFFGDAFAALEGGDDP